MKNFFLICLLFMLSMPVYADATVICNSLGRRIGTIKTADNGFQIIDKEGNIVENPDKYVVMPNIIDEKNTDTSYCYIYDTKGNLIRFPARKYFLFPENSK